MGTYIQRSNSLSPTSAVTATAIQSTLDADTGTAATLAASVPVQSLGFESHLFASVGGGGLDWGLSPYGAQIEVSAIGSSTTLTSSGRFWRESTDGTTRRTGQAGANLNLSWSSTSGTGLKSCSGSDTASPNNIFSTDAGRASTDRIVFMVLASNSNMMAAEDLTLRVNTTDSYVTVPWDVGAPPTVTPLPKVLLSTVPSNAAHRSTW